MSQPATLPIHPYSYKLMEDAINQAKINGSSTYNHANDCMPPLSIHCNKNGEFFISSSLNISNYLPSALIENFKWLGKPDYMPDFHNKTECLLSEFFAHELFQQPFKVINKQSQQVCDAMLSDGLTRKEKEMMFILVDEQRVVPSLAALNKEYDIIPAEPIRTRFKDSIHGLSDEDGWAMIEAVNWKSDHDYNRCKKEFEEKYAPNVIASMDKWFDSKTKELNTFILSIPELARNHTESHRIELVEHIVSAGKTAFDNAMNSEAAITTLMQKLNVQTGLGFPSYRQHDSYPYGMDTNGYDDPYKKLDSSLMQKASAIEAIHNLKNIDFDHVSPFRAREIKPLIEESLMRLNYILEGQPEKAFSGFDNAAYVRLCHIKESGMHAYVPNLLSDIMSEHGLDFSRVTWNNGIPTQRNKKEKSSSLDI